VVFVSGYHPIQQSSFGNSLQKFITFRAAQFKYFITLRDYLYIHCFGIHSTGILACSGERSLQFRLLGDNFKIGVPVEFNDYNPMPTSCASASQFRGCGRLSATLGLFTPLTCQQAPMGRSFLVGCCFSQKKASH